MSPPSRPPSPAPPGTVRLELFEGSLEALLHLIRTEELDVTRIPVAEVARQYDAWLDLLREPDPEAAGESLLAVATLAYLKSRRLLPREPAGAEAEPPAAGTAAPDGAGRERIREAAEHLREREAVMELVYARPGSVLAEYAEEQGIEADLYALLRAFKTILARAAHPEEGRIRRERMTLVERIHRLMERLLVERRVRFRDLFEDAADRLSCILTFLALLEVIRLRLARAYSSHHAEEILIVLAEEEPRPPAPLEEEPVHA
ncbi:MAG: segregation and condensation protein A [Candidatus Polarisedimenticolia bacterium]